MASKPERCNLNRSWWCCQSMSRNSCASSIAPRSWATSALPNMSSSSRDNRSACRGLFNRSASHRPPGPSRPGVGFDGLLNSGLTPSRASSSCTLVMNASIGPCLGISTAFSAIHTRENVANQEILRAPSAATASKGSTRRRNAHFRAGRAGEVLRLIFRSCAPRARRSLGRRISADREPGEQGLAVERHRGWGPIGACIKHQPN